MTRAEYIAGLQRARQRVLDTDSNDRAELIRVLCVLRAYMLLPRMFGGWR